MTGHGHDFPNDERRRRDALVMAEVFSSLGAIVAALVILITGWVYADPLIAAGGHQID